MHNTLYLILKRVCYFERCLIESIFQRVILLISAWMPNENKVLDDLFYKISLSTTAQTMSSYHDVIRLNYGVLQWFGEANYFICSTCLSAASL